MDTMLSSWLQWLQKLLITGCHISHIATCHFKGDLLFGGYCLDSCVFNVLKLNVMAFLYRWAHQHGCKKLWQEAGPFSFSSSSSSWYTQLHPSPNMSALVASCHVAVYRMFGFLWLSFFQLSSFFWWRRGIVITVRVSKLKKGFKS